MRDVIPPIREVVCSIPERSRRLLAFADAFSIFSALALFFPQFWRG
jgi:hypothetical protein